MRIAIVGSSGYIAGYIINRFRSMSEMDSILRIDKTEESDAVLDLSDVNNFDYSCLEDIDLVVFTAAISGPDKCADEFDKCWGINVDGTIRFIREAINRECRVLFFSSDAVFGDIPGKIYDENSPTQATTAYGKMKKSVEDEFLEETLFKAIRLSYVASANDRFISYCLKCMEKGEYADVFHPFYRNVIAVTDVVNVVTYFAFHWEEYDHRFLNVAGRELVSRIRMADELNRFFGGKLMYTVSMLGEEFFKNRPRITQMKSLYMQRYGIIEDNTFTEKIKNELKEIEL